MIFINVTYIITFTLGSDTSGNFIQIECDGNKAYIFRNRVDYALFGDPNLVTGIVEIFSNHLIVNKE